MDSFCEKNQHKKVLLVTLAAEGHLNPILRLGNILVSKGLHVTLTTPEYAREKLSSETSSVGGVHLVFFSDGLPIEYNRKANTEYYIETLDKFGPVNLTALITSCEHKFSCIISTPFVPWIADVGLELGVPNAMLWIQPCTLYQIYHRYYNKLDEFPTESNPNISVKLPGLPVFGPEELPSFVLPSNTFRCFDTILNQIFNHSMHKMKWVLVNSFMELENDVIVSLNEAGHVILPVGPLVPTSLLCKKEDVGFNKIESNENNKCINWLDKQKPSSVVYISFGTLLFLSKKEIESIYAGLKSTKRPFLWVIRSRVNQEQVPELGFLEDIKEQQGLIVSWSPQTEVLSHPSVGCFVSHCGWNSLSESMASGIPIVACPKWTDQPTNAKLVTDVWGVGVKLKKTTKGGVCGEEVRRCVEEVMSGPRSEEFRKNTARLKTAACEAMVDGGTSDKSIQMFVNEIVLMADLNKDNAKRNS